MQPGRRQAVIVGQQKQGLVARGRGCPEQRAERWLGEALTMAGMAGFRHGACRYACGKMRICVLRVRSILHVVHLGHDKPFVSGGC
jgi:hypothetical protein